MSGVDWTERAHPVRDGGGTPPLLITAMRPSPRFLRFIGGGILNTLFGYAVFVVALKLGASVPGALLASTLTGILFNFQTSRRIVFQSRQTGLLLRFTAVYVMVFAINCAAIALLTRIGLPTWAAQGVLVIPMALLAFGSQKTFVFTEPRAA